MRLREDTLRLFDEMIQAIVKGLSLDELKADQIRILAAEDRQKHDARYRREL